LLVKEGCGQKKCYPKKGLFDLVIHAWLSFCLCIMSIWHLVVNGSSLSIQMSISSKLKRIIRNPTIMDYIPYTCSRAAPEILETRNK
jgi:hypothetical protein